MMRRKYAGIVGRIIRGAGLAAFGDARLQGRQPHHSDVEGNYRLTAQFDNIGGLKVKAPVTWAGVRVGG